MRRLVGSLAVMLCVAGAARAQCRDGTPPPCARPAASAMPTIAAKPDSAFVRVERAYDKVLPGALWRAITEPAYDGYRDHPRYVALLRRAGIER